MEDLSVIDKNGKRVGEVKLAEKLINMPVEQQLLHDVIVGYQRNRRRGTASTLGKGEVAASGNKPWRQKGTGRARAGSRASTLWRSGGVAFGPKARDYRKRIPKEMKRRALLSVLAAKLREGKVIVVDSIKADPPKTKPMAGWLSRIGAGKRPLVILSGGRREEARALRNIAGVSPVSLGNLNANLLLEHDKMVIEKGDFEALQERAL